MRRLCECRLHTRSDPTYPRLIQQELRTEAVCITTAGLSHVAYRPGRQYGVIQIRVPVWLGYRLWMFTLWLRKVIA